MMVSCVEAQGVATSIAGKAGFAQELLPDYWPLQVVQVFLAGMIGGVLAEGVYL